MVFEHDLEGRGRATPERIITYNINEKNIDALIVKPEKAERLHIDIAKVRHIQKSISKSGRESVGMKNARY